MREARRQSRFSGQQIRHDSELGSDQVGKISVNPLDLNKNFGLLAVAIVAAFTMSASAAARDTDAEYEEEYSAQEAAIREARASRDETLAFMPSLAMSWGSYNQSISGTTSQLLPDGMGGTQTIAFERVAGDSLITEYFQFTGRLHTPLKLDNLPTKPRLFLSGGVQIPLASGLIAERIDATFTRRPPGQTFDTPNYTDNCPDVLPGPSGADIPSNECSMKIRNRVSIDAMWFAGLGVDLTIPAFDTNFHIMPAVEYYGLSVQTFGEFDRTTTGRLANDLVESTSTVGDAELYHGVSVSLAVGVDVFEEGPWLWSMFLQGRTVFLLNEPGISATGDTAFGQIRYDSAIDDLIFQGSGGFQIQYTGKD